MEILVALFFLLVLPYLISLTFPRVEEPKMLSELYHQVKERKAQKMSSQENYRKIRLKLKTKMIEDQLLKDGKFCEEVDKDLIEDLIPIFQRQGFKVSSFNDNYYNGKWLSIEV